MTPDLRKEIKAECDKQFQKDLDKILDTAEGRRFYSWLMEHCGINLVTCEGNHKDYYLSGRRSVACDLRYACDSLLNGLLYRHKAEDEYINFQKSIYESILAERKKAKK